MADKILGSTGTTSVLIVNGAVGSSAIDANDDDDWWRISLTAGISYTFKMTGDFGPFLRVMNSSGVQSNAGDYGEGSTDSLIKFTPASTGIYYLSALSKFNIGTGAYSLTATDDLPKIRIVSNGAEQEGDSGSTPITFVVRRSNGKGTSTVDYAVVGTGDPADASADDFFGGVLPSGTITFQDGQTDFTLTIRVVGDTSVEGLESFHIALSNPRNGTVIPFDPNDSASTGYIFDDDIAPLSVINVSAPTTAIDKYEGNGGETMFTFTISRSSDGIDDATVNWAVDHDVNGFSAASDEDFKGGVRPSGTILFEAGKTTSKPVYVWVVGDVAAEDDEYFHVTLSQPGNASLGNSSVFGGVIRNDDIAAALPVFSISSKASDRSKDEGNDPLGTSFSFTVSRSGDIRGSSAVDYAVKGYAVGGFGAASADDFVGAVLPSGRISFAAGQASQTLPILVRGDTVDESVEHFVVTLSNPEKANLDSSAISNYGDINNDDHIAVPLPVVSIGLIGNAHSKDEGDGGSATQTGFSFAISRSSGNGISTVKWNVVGKAAGTSSAASADDFIFPSAVLPWGTVKFDAGQTRKEVTVYAKGDANLEPNERFNITLSLPLKSNATLGTSSDFGIIVNDDAPDVLAAEIFRTAGRTRGDDANTIGIFNAGKIRVLADFAKAAYHLQSWELDSPYGRKINDTSPNADTAHAEVLAQGWVALDFPVQFTQFSSGNDYLNNKMQGGVYTNANAAAFVARSADAMVVAFRGTNDNASERGTDSLDRGLRYGSANDPLNDYRPDVLQWGSPDKLRLEHNLGNVSESSSMLDHYDLFRPLLASIMIYAEDSNNGINNVYVTGHSLGGAMAIQFMSQTPGSKYQAVTFAAPAFTITNIGTNAPLPTESFEDDSRMLQIEVNNDPVPKTWLFDNRPGKQLVFAGNQTSDVPDSHFPFGYLNDDNHSMDFYRQITNAVDHTSWQKILDAKDGARVLVGADSGPYASGSLGFRKFDTYYIVDGLAGGTGIPVYGTNADIPFGAGADILIDPPRPARDGPDINYDIYYGGLGKDSLAGGPLGELMLGGLGADVVRGNGGADTLYGDAGDDYLDGGIENDTLDGGADSDTLIGRGDLDLLTGGAGADYFKFITVNEGADTITDFTSGTDKILVVGPNFAGLPLGTLSATRFVASVAPRALDGNPVFLYNTNTGVLSFDNNGSASSGISTVATLNGFKTLIANDIQVVGA